MKSLSQTIKESLNEAKVKTEKDIVRGYYLISTPRVMTHIYGDDVEVFVDKVERHMVYVMYTIDGSSNRVIYMIHAPQFLSMVHDYYADAGRTLPLRNDSIPR